jgi:hypothetical protein
MSPPFSAARYYELQLYHLKQRDYGNLARRKWCSEQIFYQAVDALAVGRSQPVVPKLGGGSYLRIKVVDQSEAQVVALGMAIETVQSACGGFSYYFGQEPEQLQDKNAFGFAVSIWEKHPKVVANKLTYSFATGMLRVWGPGSPRHVSSKCGLQMFFKMAGRGSSRPHPSPAVPDEEIQDQQHFSGKYGNDPTNALLRKSVNLLTSVAIEIAQEQNPLLMKLVGHNCSMMLVTTGSVPQFTPDAVDLESGDPSFPKEEAARKKRKEAAKRKFESLSLEPDPASALDSDSDEEGHGHFGDDCDIGDAEPSGGEDSSSRGSSLLSPPVFTKANTPVFRETMQLAPPVGVIISSHLDSPDNLSKDQKSQWLAKSRSKGWTYCESILEHPMFCLPTTCAYQFCFNDVNASKELQVKAFFSMEGLGLARPIVHGISHHFMGAAFTHNTCIPILRRYRDQLLNCSNSDNRVLIVGWGSHGGRKQVALRRSQRIASRNSQG